MQRDLLIAENVARAAERAGLGQIVYLSGLGDDQTEVVGSPSQPTRDRGAPERGTRSR